MRFTSAAKRQGLQAAMAAHKQNRLNETKRLQRTQLFSAQSRQACCSMAMAACLEIMPVRLEELCKRLHPRGIVIDHEITTSRRKEAATQHDVHALVCCQAVTDVLYLEIKPHPFSAPFQKSTLASSSHSDCTSTGNLMTCYPLHGRSTHRCPAVYRKAKWNAVVVVTAAWLHGTCAPPAYCSWHASISHDPRPS